MSKSHTHNIFFLIVTCVETSEMCKYSRYEVSVLNNSYYIPTQMYNGTLSNNKSLYVHSVLSVHA